MPEERGYQQQVRPQAAAPMPLANAEQFGAGVADAAMQFGQQLHRSELRAYEIERRNTADSEAAAFGRRFAETREELDAISRERRGQALPGGAGHSELMRQAFEERRAALLEGITEDSVRRQAEASLDDFGGRFRGREADWQEGQRVGALVSDRQSATAISANRARRAAGQEGGADAYSEELQIGRADIEAMPGVPPDVRARLTREHDQQVTVGFVNGLNDSNPQMAIAMLNSGLFDDVLEPQQVDGLRQRAEQEMRALQMEANARARAAVADNREYIDGIQREAADGVPIDDDRLAEAQRRATESGLSGEAYDIAGLRVRSATNREFRSATPLQIEQALRAADADIAQAGDRATPGQVVRRNHLRTLLAARTTQIDNDPAAFGASIGIRFEPLDPGNPDSVAARVRAANATAEATGRPPAYLTPQEATQMRANMGTPAGRMTALQVAGSFRRASPQGVRLVAQQLAPNDPLFVHAAGMRGEVGSQILEGRTIWNRSFRPPTRLAAQLDRQLGAALRHLPEQSRNNVLASAQFLYAFYAARDGTPDGPDAPLQAGLLQNVVRMAAGGNTFNGEWRGGIGEYRGRQVVLPTDMSEGQFEEAMGNIRRTGLVTRAGEEISAESLRRNYVPVLLPSGRYGFVGPDGAFAVVNGRSGVPGEVDINRLYANGRGRSAP